MKIRNDNFQLSHELRIQGVGLGRGIIVPCRAVGLRGINPEEFPQVRQGLNVATPVIAGYRGVQVHPNVRGTQRGKPQPNTTGESFTTKTKKTKTKKTTTTKTIRKQISRKKPTTKNYQKQKLETKMSGQTESVFRMKCKRISSSNHITAYCNIIETKQQEIEQPLKNL